MTENDHSARIRATMFNAYGRPLTDHETMFINRHHEALARELAAEREKAARLRQAVLRAARTPYTDRDEDGESFADAVVSGWLYDDGLLIHGDLDAAPPTGGEATR